MSNPLHHALDDAATSVGVKILAAGSVTAGGSGMAGKVVRQASEDPAFAERAMSLSDIGVIVGIALGFIGFATQVFFQWRRNREQAAHNRAVRQADAEFKRAQLKLLEQQAGGNDPA